MFLTTGSVKHVLDLFVEVGFGMLVSLITLGTEESVTIYIGALQHMQYFQLIFYQSCKIIESIMKWLESQELNHAKFVANVYRGS